MIIQTVTVTIDRHGDVTIDTQGFDGVECLETTAAFEKDFGTVSERTFKLKIKPPSAFKKKAPKRSISVG